MGIFSERFAMNYKELPWMVLLCFARASLPRGQSSSGIGHTPILSKTYHVIMKSPARLLMSLAQQTQVLNELCFAASQGTCLATFQCVKSLFVDVMTLHNCCPHFMSGLVDMWTSMMAKLREKGQTMFSNGSSLTNVESSQRVQAKEKEESSTGLVPDFSRFMRVNSPVVLYSEASVSILECLSA
ncbi:hypothetical protein CMV_023473 [Castanea mollissima]|uniref:Uncharacterized protein n=1 Tax=Castanea mollissima TaxID=60419 RepID=A0A8J4QL52_9ROSI|nr:hypothetical protein CMV_023473 [Castanea mollissima]